MNVALRGLEVHDPVQGVAVPAWLLHPTRAAETTQRFGPYAIEAARDAELPREPLPLVVVSHGNSSSPWTHRGLALQLARDGFAVAMLEHPGNSRSDNSLFGTIANLENRPRHVRRVIDAVERLLGPAPSVAIVGHSIGAYTALAVAGGRPTCTPHESPDGAARAVEVDHDPRVRALVLLAPAAIWFALDGALDGVRVPVLMRSGELDDAAPPSIHAAIVARGVRDLDHRVVPNAGHFSFQSPFPAEMTRPQFPPSQDPPGFDRAAYQRALCDEVLAFLRARG